jgi:hypothetical protein
MRRFLAGATDFSLLQSVQTAYGVCPALFNGYLGKNGRNVTLTTHFCLMLTFRINRAIYNNGTNK